MDKAELFMALLMWTVFIFFMGYLTGEENPLEKWQRKLLERIANGEWHTISDTYQPCQYIVANGLADGVRSKYGAYKIRITDKGMEAMK